jgi:ribosome maturation factor RimP
VEGDEVRLGVDDKEYVLHLDAIDKANIIPRFD